MWEFPYKPDIAINSLLFLCNRAKEKERILSFMQVVKLLFYCDKIHLKKYGRPITGDNYIAMRDGPNPSSIYDYLKSVRFRPGRKDHHIQVELQPNPPYSDIPNVIPLRQYDPNVFSETDKEVLEEVFSLHGHKSAKELRDMSHKEKAWEAAEFEMKYEDFLDDNDNEMRNYIEEIQSDWKKLNHLVKHG